MTRYCKQDNGGTIFTAVENQQAFAAKKNTGIPKAARPHRLGGVSPAVEELPRNWKKGGKPQIDHVCILKVLFLQKYHGLFDEATEEQIFDRTSLKIFLGLRIGSLPLFAEASVN